MMTGCGNASHSDVDASPGFDGSTANSAGEIAVVSGGGQAVGRGLGTNVGASFPEGEAVVWHTESARAGACRLLEYTPSFCDPVCNGVCVAPGQCQPFPVWRSAGMLTFTGLAQPLSLEPQPGSNVYASAGGLAEPLFQPGVEVTANASGALVPAFTISGRGVARVATDVAEAGVVTLPPSGDLIVTWRSPDAGARVRVTITGGTQLHGLPSPSVLVCEAPDTGSLTIAAALIEAFPSVGRGCVKMRDCASFGILRYTRSSVTVAGGEVVLLVGSGTDYEVVHE
jgi:hypothetical protein